MELLSAASRILFHFQSQNSSVAASAPERATEYSETTFGTEELKRAGVWKCVRQEILYPLTLFFSPPVFRFQEPVVAVFLFWDF